MARLQLADLERQDGRIERSLTPTQDVLNHPLTRRDSKLLADAPVLWWRRYRPILIFGVTGGLLAATLRFIEYRFLVVDHSIAIYGGLVAALFAAVGIRLGLSLTRTREVTIVKEVPVAAPVVFSRNEAQVAALALTPREVEILDQIAAGKSAREIAAALFVSENTVKTHTSRLYDKLGVNRRTQAVQEARRLGLLP